MLFSGRLDYRRRTMVRTAAWIGEIRIQREFRTREFRQRTALSKER
ncbi:hypothetical protein [Nocardia crassostreae]|nr:hypothetical protein [Nocardia crassostreae]